MLKLEPPNEEYFAAFLTKEGKPALFRPVQAEVKAGYDAYCDMVGYRSDPLKLLTRPDNMTFCTLSTRKDRASTKELQGLGYRCIDRDQAYNFLGNLFASKESWLAGRNYSKANNPYPYKTQSLANQFRSEANHDTTLVIEGEGFRILEVYTDHMVLENYGRLDFPINQDLEKVGGGWKIKGRFVGLIPNSVPV
jgi:hypothetical protein